MRIYIHSSGRSSKCITCEAMPYATILVQADQYRDYARDNPTMDILPLPPGITTLSPTRQWILDNCPEDKVMMLDDDLRFMVRRKDDRTKLLPATVDDVTQMIMEIEKELDNFAHVGVLARQGANRVLETPRVLNTRMMRLLAYDLNVVRKVGARFDRVVTKQDFDMTLQLLRAGYPNSVLTEYAQDQPGSNTAGGCSIYRTKEVMTEGALRLKSLHPDFVKIVEKPEVGTWGSSRLDVQVQWKKALESFHENQ